MSDSTGSTSDRLTTAQLLGIATALDPTTTERRLEFWRNQGLLPHPERTGQDGTRPVWSYPSEAADQLRALLRLRKTTKNPDVLRVALWFDGYAVPTPLARTAMIGHLHKSRTEVEREIERHIEKDSDDQQARRTAIEHVAQVQARRRKGLPRSGRQRQQDRDRAVATTFKLVLNEPHVSEGLDEASAAEVENLLGLTPGRTFRPGDVEPWLSGPAVSGLASFAKFGSLDTLIEAVESANDAELDAARASARLLVTGLDFAVRLADAMSGRSNVSGLTAMVEVAQTPEIHIWMTALLLSLRRSAEHAESVTQLLQALAGLRPLEAQIRAIAAMPEDDRAGLLKGLPALPLRDQGQDPTCY